MADKELKTVLESIDKDFISTLPSFLSFCSRPSISKTGEGIRESVDHISRVGKSCGFECKVAQEGSSHPYMILKYRSGNPKFRVGWYNHYDVQPTGPIEDWTYPPFITTLKNGRIYGRGVADDKGEIFARFEAFKAIKKSLGNNFPLSITWIIDGEEEIGSPHLSRFVKRYSNILDSDLYFWEGASRGTTPDPNIIMGCRGVVVLEISTERKSGASHSQHAGKVPNSAWNLLSALSTFVTLNDGSARLRSKKYRNLFANLSRLTSGSESSATTSIPSKALAMVDIRIPIGFGPKEIVEWISQTLRNHNFRNIKMKVVSQVPPSYTNPSLVPLEELKAAVRVAHKKEVNVIPVASGTSPMFTVTTILKRPCISLPGLGHAKTNQHGSNENIFVKDLRNSIKMHAAIIYKLAKQD